MALYENYLSLYRKCDGGSCVCILLCDGSVEYWYEQMEFSTFDFYMCIFSLKVFVYKVWLQKNGKLRISDDNFDFYCCILLGLGYFWTSLDEMSTWFRYNMGIFVSWYYKIFILMVIITQTVFSCWSRVFSNHILEIGIGIALLFFCIL